MRDIKCFNDIPFNNNSFKIANENYQLAFQYLDEVYFIEMTREERKTWDLPNGLGSLLNFYFELIRKLPYNKTKIVKRLKLNHSKKLPLIYNNLEKLIWKIEFDNNKIQTSTRGYCETK
ncbi:MAG: hypothetical protein OEV44_02725 [Spirochaetota bacterium]|nr:hypothetical protein [Spirochaetota bacterium]